MATKKKNAQLIFADAQLDILFYAWTVNEQIVVDLRQVKGLNTEDLIIATNESIEEYKLMIEQFKRLRQEATTF